ncbi:hypothetical protein [Ornithinibacillus hominis]|uniref:hypothetical protein n=1 Tax=Ornithinibacillus hominis TaxID=2763055 RepID=UPI002102BFF8|nr:hypothetical protein [Ornithinibacillus hominis]
MPRIFNERLENHDFLNECIGKEGQVYGEFNYVITLNSYVCNFLFLADSSATKASETSKANAV